MKYKRHNYFLLKFIPVWILTFLLLLGCAGDGTEKAKDELEETGEKMEQIVMQEKQALKKSISATRDKLETKLTELEVQLETVSDDTREEISQEITTLKAKEAQLQKLMDSLESEMGDTWKDFKLRTEGALKELDQALNEMTESEVEE